MNVPRSFRRYGEPAPGVPIFTGHDPDTPTAGFYRMRLRSGGVFVGVRIWHGLPLDPVTLEEMDRAPRWNAQINGRWADLSEAWPQCAGEPIPEREYDFLTKQQAWAAQNLPDSALADPTKRVDPLTSPMMF